MGLKILVRYRKGKRAGPEINTRQAPNASENWCWQVYEMVSIGSWAVTFL